MYGDAQDSAKGRQMPVHFSFAPPAQPVHFFSISSPIGTHVPQAVGAAYAMKYRKEDGVALASFGDGGTNGHDPGMGDQELLHAYRTMLRTRVFDDTCMKLQRSGRIGFSIPNKGVEGTQIGAASALRKTDWFFPSYRDFGMALYHGVSMLDMMSMGPEDRAAFEEKTMRKPSLLFARSIRNGVASDPCRRNPMP